MNTFIRHEGNKQNRKMTKKLNKKGQEG